MEFDFTTNQTLEDVSKVPEQFRGAYVQGSDGVFVISDAAKGLVEAVTGLNKSLKASRNETKTLRTSTADPKTILADLGIEAEDMDGAKEAIEALRKQVAEKANVDPAKLRADIERGFQAKQAESDKKVQAMEGTLQRYLVQSAAAQALAAAKGNAELLLPHVAARAKVVQDGEDYVVRIVDDAGDYRGDGKGGYMTVADLVAEMKGSSTFKQAFESEAPRGTGARPNGSTRPVRTEASGPTNPADKIKAGLAARRR